MVAHLVSLKWRYVLASLKRSVWAIIGIAFGALYLLGTLTGLGFAYVGLGIDGSLDGPALALFLGFLVSLGWALIPIVWTGLDGTLDESRFVLFPLEAKTLQKGQFFGGFIGLPGIATIILILLGTLGFIGNPVGLAAYLLSIVLGLALLMTVARLANQLGVYLNANPRIDLIFKIILGVLLVSSGFIFSGAIFYVIDHFQEIAQNVQWLGYTPFGSAFAIAYHVAAGNWALAGLSLVLSLIYLGGAWVLWGRSLERSMRNVSGEQKRGKAKNLTAGDIGIFARFPNTGWGAVAARTIHSYFKDTRMTLLIVMTAMLYVLFALVMPLFTSSMGSRVATTGIQLANSGAGPETLFGFWVYFCNVFTGFYIAYMVSYDNTAFSLHVLSPLRGRDDRLGRALGHSIVMLPIVVVMSFIMCAVHGLIAYYPVVLLHQLGVYAGTVGFGLMLDTVLSPPVAPPGANPFKTPKQPDGFAKQLLLMGSMIICMLIALPGGIGSFIYMVGGKDDMVLIISGVIQLVIGAALFIIGISAGGKLYDRHSSMMLQRVAKFNTN